MAKRPIFYDTETTGIKSERDRIIEIAAYDPIMDRTFVQFVNPQMPIPFEATQIHKITDDMVKDAPSFKEVGEAFSEFCGIDAVLVAHNNDQFDKLFLECEYKRASISLPQWHYVDSLKWARKYRSDLPRHSLQHLREVYGIAANQAHRALDDVMVLYQVFIAMTDDLPIEKILELLSKSSQTQRMPFGKYQGRPLAEVPKDYVLWLKDSGAFNKMENRELKENLETLGLLAK